MCNSESDVLNRGDINGSKLLEHLDFWHSKGIKDILGKYFIRPLKGDGETGFASNKHFLKGHKKKVRT